MADDAAPQAETLQPRPTAWVTGGGALTYARPVPDADEATPTADDDDANESEGGLDDDAATSDSDTDSDGDEAAWAAADLLLDQTDGTVWVPVKFNLEAHTKLRQDVKCSDFRQCVDKLRESMTYRAHTFLKAVPQQFQIGAQRLIKAIIVEDFKRPEPVDGYNEMLVRHQTVDFLGLL